MRNIFLSLFLFVSFLSTASEPVIYKISLQQEVNAASWIHINEGFKLANEMEADAVLIHMNTYGGEVLYADSIRIKILNSAIPVYVFIDNNAASAGALIAIACDKIYMRKGSNIGAATVVNGMDGQAMPDKYQSYMRATMRATAEAHGKDTIVSAQGDTIFRWKRDPIIAEAMVDDRVYIEHISDSGKVLTFTATEALQHGYCDGIAETVDEVIGMVIHTDSYELVEYVPSAKDNIKGFLMGSILRSILIMIIIGGIYYELQTPGIGFPLAASIIAAILYFAPLYIDGLAANWEIIIFIIGVLLLLAEIFIIPGFGIAGVSGIILIITGLLFSMLDNDLFNFDNVESIDMSRSVLTTVVGLFGAFAIIIYLSSKIGTGMFRKLALETTQDVQEGYISVDKKGFDLVGRTGVTSTMLRPSGKVVIDGTNYDAISVIGYIEKGTPVKVIRFETGQIYVQKDESHSAGV